MVIIDFVMNVCLSPTLEAADVKGSFPASLVNALSCVIHQSGLCIRILPLNFFSASWTFPLSLKTSFKSHFIFVPFFVSQRDYFISSAMMEFISVVGVGSLTHEHSPISLAKIETSPSYISRPRYFLWSQAW